MESKLTAPVVAEQCSCYHCGENCDDSIQFQSKPFCCEGCKFVYQLLDKNGLCNYYDLSKQPGLQAKGKFKQHQFAYLDHEEVQRQLIRFTDGKQSRVLLHLPQMHCASCVWLLENLHRIEPGILHSQTNFQQKEITIQYLPEKVSLRKIVELLAFVGYEPYISLGDVGGKKQKRINRTQIFKIGVAGFCFSNIMMLSFPEYFSGGNIDEAVLKQVFIYLNLVLSLPVLLFSASDFFTSAWAGLRQKWLNIDAPIALAILVAFGRSVYEILSHTGAGYLDSMSGIVFFMLAGRWFQNKTYDSYSFDRDYKSYFPLGVTVLKEGQEENIAVTQLNKQDIILVRNEEMVPADSLLRDETALVDYSFVSGENTPIRKNKGELIYAGGKINGTAVEMEVVTPVSQSYITQLWNNDVFTNRKNKEQSFIHPWSRYFTLALFGIALASGVYWWWNDTSKIGPAVTSVLIVACPCSLLLTATFTYGNMLRRFGRNKMYLKNAGVIEALGKINTVVFDKTGTITQHHQSVVTYNGDTLSQEEQQLLLTVTRQSSHPLSRLIYETMRNTPSSPVTLADFKEYPGKGLKARSQSMELVIGSTAFVNDPQGQQPHNSNETQVHVRFSTGTRGVFLFSNQYREGMKETVQGLRKNNLDLFVLSGDNDAERLRLQDLFGSHTGIHFRKTPQEKLEFIETLQQEKRQVLMMGDGLNDAGALQQGQVGVAVTDNTNQFSPASDAILDGAAVHKLDRFILYARSSKAIISGIFVLSILYNIVGMYYATQALLSPLIAAILMPVSSISIVLCAALFSTLSARRLGL
jgi:Cu+-exporting ATPase